ncbi:MAG: hypothetical protein IPJ43_02325 [Saprospiraceae bacterium]|nr:hypothetical protein [Saprospiraceae bacterium]
MDIKIIVCIWISVCIFSCQSKNDISITKDQGKKLASYKSTTLYQNDLIEQSAFKYEDSAAIPASEIESWLKNQILLDEAKSFVEDKSEIDKLVDDYKNSLYIHRYETKLIQEKLDSTIKDEELIKYYQSNKADYKLEDSYVRILFLKIPKKAKADKNIETWMKESTSVDLFHLRKFCDNIAEQCFLSPNTWIKWKDIQIHVPSKLINSNSLHSGLYREFADFEYSFFIKIIEVIKPNQEPPISYIKEKAMNTILHKRKLLLLDNIKRELYDKEVQNKNIKFY